jgi:hypothetical protein
VSEATLRASNAVLSGTTEKDWPMVAHSTGHGDVIVPLDVGWDANNMQYAGVLVSVAGVFQAKITLLNAAGVDATPTYTLEHRYDLSDGTGAYVALLNPSGVTPPAIGGTTAYKIRLDGVSWNGPFPGADWELGIFERIPYTPPDPGDGGGGGTDLPCPPRPEWPYPLPSISGQQGRIGVMRGARR